MIGAIRRRWDRRGRLPDDLRAELDAEGLELLEERLPLLVIFRGYVFPGQRPRSGDQSGLAALALTRRRLVVHGTGNIRLDVPHGADWLQVGFDAPDGLKLTHDAAAVNPNRAGEIEMRLQTPRAEAIHATLREWMTTPPA